MENENKGQGGSFLLDPKTGKRKLIERTEPAPTPAPLLEDLTDEPKDPQTPSKVKD